MSQRTCFVPAIFFVVVLPGCQATSAGSDATQFQVNYFSLVGEAGSAEALIQSTPENQLDSLYGKLNTEGSAVVGILARQKEEEVKRAHDANGYRFTLTPENVEQRAAVMVDPWRQWLYRMRNEIGELIVARDWTRLRVKLHELDGFTTQLAGQLKLPRPIKPEDGE